MVNNLQEILDEFFGAIWELKEILGTTANLQKPPALTVTA